MQVVAIENIYSFIQKDSVYEVQEIDGTALKINDGWWSSKHFKEKEQNVT